MELETIVGPVVPAEEDLAGTHPHAAPGMHPRHYSPRTPLYLTTNGRLPDLGKGQGRGFYLRYEHPPSGTNVAIHQMPATAVGYGAALYDVLHSADTGNFNWIAVDLPPSTPEWEAIQDRLKRAATK